MNIAVVGASGHTGRFVVAELERQGLAPVPVGRSTTCDAASLDAVLSGCAAVINCAGPFLDTALTIADAALRARIPYLDVTAEQAAALLVFTRDGAAREAGVALVPGAAFYGGLADVLATACAGQAQRVDEITVAVALDSWHPTKGTRLTGARNTAPRSIVRNGALSPLSHPPAAGSWRFPDPFGTQEMLMLPFSETITLFHHLSASSIESWINLRALNDIRDATTPPPQSIDEGGRSAQTFVMDVIVRTGRDAVRATASGQDIYAITAPIVVGAARALVDGHAPPQRGVRTLGEIVDSHEFLATLVREGHLRVNGPRSANECRA